MHEQVIQIQEVVRDLVLGGVAVFVLATAFQSVRQRRRENKINREIVGMTRDNLFGVDQNQVLLEVVGRLKSGETYPGFVEEIGDRVSAANAKEVVIEIIK